MIKLELGAFSELYYLKFNLTRYIKLNILRFILISNIQM